MQFVEKSERHPFVNNNPQRSTEPLIGLWQRVLEPAITYEGERYGTRTKSY